MRPILLSLLLALTASAADLALTGIAHVAVRVSNLDQARDFYTRVLGFAEPVQGVFQVNDRQSIEVYPNLPPGEDIRLAQVCLASSNIRKTFDALAAAGLHPRPVKTSRRTLVQDPDGQTIAFFQPPLGKVAGKWLSPNRVSTRILHAGVMAADEQKSMAFYRDQLGLTETWRYQSRWINLRIPSDVQQYLELMLYQGTPTRENRGSMQHICLEVPDIDKAWQTLRARGVPDDESHRPRQGRNKRWQLNLWDPDGTRVELMEPSSR